ncbi:MAG: cupin domain-containing protein [Candidatus Abawacabacteria bacterium]|nr:cupin domain-containing protein [Candidatus Abawacabacteria bacterium]
MHIFPQKAKTVPGTYYFGEFDDNPKAPFSISWAKLTRNNYQMEKKHYHTKHQKVFVTLAGEGSLNVNGQETKMVPEKMIQVEPGEIHFLQKIISEELEFIVVLAAKENDKVVIE